MKRIFVLFALAFTSAPAMGESTTYAKVPSWTIFRDEHSCSMGSSFDRDTLLMVDYDYTLSSTLWMITDPALKSVQDGDKLSLELFFRKNGKLDDGWGTVPVNGFRTQDGTPGLTFKLKSEAALTDLATSTTVALTYDDRVVESLSLSDSALAVAKLRECAAQAARENPSDPLAGVARKP